MKKITLYIAQTLDGFVASKDENVAWLDDFFSEDYGYDEFIKEIDTVIQGNTTFQQFKTVHEGKKNYVFTSHPDKHSDKGVTFVRGIDNFGTRVCDPRFPGAHRVISFAEPPEYRDPVDPVEAGREEQLHKLEMQLAAQVAEEEQQ